MNRNVAILIVILVILALAFYLVWLRNRFQTIEAPSRTTLEQLPTPTPEVTSEAATAGAARSLLSPSPVATPTATPAKVKPATPSGKVVR